MLFYLPLVAVGATINTLGFPRSARFFKSLMPQQNVRTVQVTVRTPLSEANNFIPVLRTKEGYESLRAQASLSALCEKENVNPVHSQPNFSEEEGHHVVLHERGS